MIQSFVKKFVIIFIQAEREWGQVRGIPNHFKSSLCLTTSRLEAVRVLDCSLFQLLPSHKVEHM